MSQEKDDFVHRDEERPYMTMKQMKDEIRDELLKDMERHLELKMYLETNPMSSMRKIFVMKVYYGPKQIAMGKMELI